ncbi:RidA family protein [Roseovarius aestuarii]|uniref:Enamine/imine deaminase n=1 Tax=Roseovarius aestuarii TaxID=475083 RepID=A0A1X7BVJ7_9RHOB|nr:RidA family protein [Roseovarius aestuarii]SMC13623.1 Enamine/imine deaminase [Roseovarius aestuarii]
MNDIIRHGTKQRMSAAVRHGNTIYLAGQVGNAEDGVADQTRTCLEKVEELLAQMDSDKQRILQTTIWLADMADFAEMNAVWDAWVPEGHAPARACGESKLARPELKVEILVVAAARPRDLERGR